MAPRRARLDCLRPHRTTRLLVIELLKRYFQRGNQSAASSLNPTSDAKAIRGPPATLQSDRDLSTRTHSLKPPSTSRISFRLLWNATHVRSLRRRRVEKPQYGPTMQTAYAKSASDNQVRIPSVRIITDASLERPPGRAPGIGEPPALACSQGLPGPSPEDLMGWPWA